MDPNDHGTLPVPSGDTPSQQATSAETAMPTPAPIQQPDFTAPPRVAGQPAYGNLMAPTQPQYGQARRPNPFAQAQAARPYEPEQPLYPQPDYATPFRPAPQQPNYPYQPMMQNPAPNPYQVSPLLPEAYLSQNQAARPMQQPMPQTVAAPPAPAGHSRAFKVVVTLVVIVMLGIAGGLGYLFYSQTKGNHHATPKKPAVTQPQPKQEVPKEETPTPQPDPTPQPVTKALAELTKMSFGAPATIPDGYKPFDYKTPGVNAYVTDGRRCELQYGTLSADVLPGNDALDIIKRQVQTLRDKGGTLSDPVAMADLKLADADAANNKTSYTLQSFSFNGVVKNGLHVRSNYAVAVLKDGNRAYVLRTCNDSADVPASALDGLEIFAAGLTIHPEN